MGLRKIYGNDNVIASSRRVKEGHEDLMESGVFEIVNVTDANQLAEVVRNIR